MYERDRKRVSFDIEETVSYFTNKHKNDIPIRGKVGGFCREKKKKKAKKLL